MINKTPTGWTGHLEDQLGHCYQQNYDVWESSCYRLSSLLSPNGEPLKVYLPKQKIGFHVNKNGKGSE